MDDLTDFRAFYELADRLITDASKEEAAEAARLLALNVAHYQLKFGALPLENFAEMLRAESIDAGTAELLSAGMQNLVGALGQAMGLADDGAGDEVHLPPADSPSSAAGLDYGTQRPGGPRRLGVVVPQVRAGPSHFCFLPTNQKCLLL